MSKWTVPGVFAALAIFAAVRTVHAIGDAIDAPTLRAGLIAVYFVLRTGVATAFAVLTVRRPPPLRRTREPAALAACAVAMVLVIPIGAPGADTSTGLVIAGEAIALVAGLWLFVSVLALGNCFGVLPEARGLVIGGPYRFVRHPVYLGEIGALDRPHARRRLVLASDALDRCSAARVPRRAVGPHAHGGTRIDGCVPGVPRLRNVDRTAATAPSRSAHASCQPRLWSSCT